MLRLHVKLPCHLVAVISAEIVIERLSVSTYTPAYASGVSSENGAHSWQLGFNIKEPHSGGPFIEMSYYILICKFLVVANAFYHQSGGMRERARLIIIAIGVKRVDMVQIPHTTIKFVFDGIHSIKLHENDNGLARYIPSANSHADTFGKRGFSLPVLQQD